MVVSGTLLISTGTYDIAVYSIPSSGSLVTARVGLTNSYVQRDYGQGMLVRHVVHENPVFYRNHPHCMVLVAKNSVFKTVVRFQ